MNESDGPLGACSEPALQGDARDLWRVVHEHFTGTLLQVRPDGTIVFLSRPPNGIAAAQLLGSNLLDLLDREVRETVRRCLLTMAPSDGARRRLVHAQLPDGTRRLYATAAIPVVHDGQVAAVTISARDLSLHRPSEMAGESDPDGIAEQIRQLQRVQLTGLLAAGLVHDFNNLLTVIGSAADMLHEDLERGSPLRADVENMQRAIRQGANLTRQLLLLAKRQTMDRARVELEATVQEVATMARVFLGKRIRLVTQLEAPAAMVVLESGGIEQILLNLLLNARDAMPDGGTILISTARLTYSAGTAPRGCKLRGRVIRLRVVDSGTGMDQATRDRIFQPFFSTKPPERGTGLGLPTIEAIVKDAGGCLELASQPGAGTVVDVVLPDADRVAIAA